MILRAHNNNVGLNQVGSHEHFQFHTIPQRTVSTSEPWVSWQELMSVDQTDYLVIKVRPPRTKESS